jgi:hypothetical protein
MYPSFHLAFGSCLILYKLCRNWRFFLCRARGVFSFSSLNGLYAELGWFGFNAGFLSFDMLLFVIFALVVVRRFQRSSP